jgi:hypothetical protein
VTTSRIRIRRAKELSARRTLELLLDAHRVAQVAGDISTESLTVLLALKTGPAHPAELAEALACSAAVVRQRVFRAKRNPTVKTLLRVESNGRYALTAKGHRRVNEVASFAIHHVLRPESVTPATPQPSPE